MLWEAVMVIKCVSTQTSVDRCGLLCQLQQEAVRLHVHTQPQVYEGAAHQVQPPCTKRLWDLKPPNIVCWLMLTSCCVPLMVPVASRRWGQSATISYHRALLPLAEGLTSISHKLPPLSLKLFSHMNGERLQHCRYMIADCIVMKRLQRIKMHTESAFLPKRFVFVAFW